MGQKKKKTITCCSAYTKWLVVKCSFSRTTLSHSSYNHNVMHGVLKWEWIYQIDLRSLDLSYQTGDES